MTVERRWRHLATPGRAIGIRRCARCGIDPVARPDRRRDTVDGRYCPGCVDDCLADRHPGH